MLPDRFLKAAGLLVVLGLISAACGGGGTKTPTPKKGGKIIVAAEQWAQCPNPVTQCAAASWQQWAINEHIYPAAMRYDPTTKAFKATELLAEEPSVANGDIKETAAGGMTITYKINPAAVWDDKSPITSTDFDFTRKAMVNTKGSYYSAGSGYDLITGVDTTDPKTAVVAFKKVYAAWGDVFGGLTFVLKAAAFPNADKDKPDLSTEMQTGVPFSGGPWKMTSWSKTEEVLVPNTNYWVADKIPLLDQVTLVPREDQNTEINAVLSGEVIAAGSPQPGNVSITKRIASNPNIKAVATAGVGSFWEAIWINTDKTYPAENGKPNPLNDIKVREALAYAIDREAVNTDLIQLNNPGSQVLNCGLLAYPNTFYCPKTPYDKYKYDPAKSVELLKAAGYDCSDVPAKPCSKGGVPLVLRYRTTAGNARRSTTQDLLKEGIKGTGFDLDVKNAQATDLFTNAAPKGDFQIADFASGGTIDPSPQSSMACVSVPTKANGYGGNNFDRWCDPELDKKLVAADAELDTAKRLALLEPIFQYQADNLVFLPMYVLPQMTVWDASKLVGPVEEWIGSPHAGLMNMYDWYLK